MSSSADSIHEEKATMGHNAGVKIVSASGGDFAPAPHENVAAQKKIANPAPLGLGAFALTTFVLSLINLKADKVVAPNIVVALAFAYGGLIQLLAGMWEMAIGNTFGATALSSYGGFWISFGIILTPAFDIVPSYTDAKTGMSDFDAAFALYLWAWFVFTTLCMLLTLRSTVAFASLFIVLDLAFLFLALSKTVAVSAPSTSANLGTAGGAFGLVAALLAWYNMFAGMANKENFWFEIPVSHLPWSEKRKSERALV